MTRKAKVSSIVLLVLVLAVGTLAFALSHTSACGVAPAVPAGVASMRAATYRCYGSPDVVKIETLAKPTPGDHVLLVRVHAASLNALAWHIMRGEPYVVRAMTGLGAPKHVRLGADGKQQFLGLLANPLTAEDISVVSDLLASGKLNPVIDKRYSLEQTSEALRYLGTGKVRGKLIVRIDQAAAGPPTQPVSQSTP
jgi:D-arabinose 1-dehydrogenase-like Zn-dependent alcohol dehydrogenase